MDYENQRLMNFSSSGARKIARIILSNSAIYRHLLANNILRLIRQAPSQLRARLLSSCDPTTRSRNITIKGNQLTLHQLQCQPSTNGMDSTLIESHGTLPSVNLCHLTQKHVAINQSGLIAAEFQCRWSSSTRRA
jgi:hypothetical protein